jgi:hypothetical protein
LIARHERHLPSPRHRANASIGVDPQRICREAEIARRLPEGVDERPGLQPRELGREARVVGEEVLEHERLLVAQRFELLILRRDLEVASVEVVADQRVLELRFVPVLRAVTEPVATHAPRRGDWPEANRRCEVGVG